MKICLTGGIACGKSLLSRYLNELGIETLDADDIVHELIPDAERARLAEKVFADPVARKELEARIHPIVRERIAAFLSEPSERLRIAVIPLVYETHWEKDFDVIACVAAPREVQIERMIEKRGMTRSAAIARLDAQMPAMEKAKISDFVIMNDGTEDGLRAEAKRFVEWLKVRN